MLTIRGANRVDYDCLEIIRGRTEFWMCVFEVSIHRRLHLLSKSECKHGDDRVQWDAGWDCLWSMSDSCRLECLVFGWGCLSASDQVTPKCTRLPKFLDLFQSASQGWLSCQIVEHLTMNSFATSSVFHGRGIIRAGHVERQCDWRCEGMHNMAVDRWSSTVIIGSQLLLASLWACLPYTYVM